MRATGRLVAGVFAVLLMPACSAPKPTAPEVPEPASAPPPTIAQRFGDDGFLTLIDPGTGLGLKAGGEIPLTAQTCGACHQAIYAEWQQTTHASALKDLQFIAEISKPSNPRWLCLNCHIPLQPQRQYLVQPETLMASAKGLEIARVPNPSYDPLLAAEAITCATCHVRRGPDGRGVVVGPRGSADSPHLVRKDRDALHGICTQCHSPGEATISPTLTCWFRTAEELAAGPNAQQDCVDCHMPPTERPVAAGSPPRKNTRHHFWAGGAVPKSFAAYDTLQARDYRPAVDVTVDRVETGAQTRVHLTLANLRGGHAVPTADPERHLLVEALLHDAQGAQLSRATAHIGQHWDYGDAATGREAHKLSDNRLLPGERRALTLVLPTGGTQLTVQVKHGRLSPTNAAYTAKAQVPAEVRALAPEAAAQLPELSTHYPLFTYVFAERRDLQSGATSRDDLATLLERSKAAAGWSQAKLKIELAE